jgi:hypothetical protein
MHAKRLKDGTGKVHVGVMMTLEEAKEAASTLGPFTQGSGLLHRMASAIASELEDHELCALAPAPTPATFHRERVITPLHQDLPPIHVPSMPAKATPQPVATTEWVVRVWRTAVGGRREPHHSISRPFTTLGAAHDFFERTQNVHRTKAARGEAPGYDVVLGRRDLRGDTRGRETGWEELKVESVGITSYAGQEE